MRRTVGVLAAVLCSGCMTAQIMEARKTEALQLVRFERGCAGRVVDQMGGSDFSMRYRVACPDGSAHVVLCENAGVSAADRRDMTEMMLMGGQTMGARCSILSSQAPPRQAAKPAPPAPPAPRPALVAQPAASQPADEE